MHLTDSKPEHDPCTHVLSIDGIPFATVSGLFPEVCRWEVLILALACTWLDGPLEKSIVEIVPWIAVSTDAARSSLATISSAMVSIAGIVFSLMLVTLSITSSQYGSRLLRTFMSDTVTQGALGMLVGTSLFCMTALAGIQDTPDGESASNISVIVGLALAIASLAVLIGFLHHVASLIQAPNVVAAVACDLDASFDRLFPEEIGETLSERASEFQPPEAGSGSPVLSRYEGYLQAIDSETLLHLAKKRNLFVCLCVKPGEFIELGQPLLEIWPDEAVFARPAADRGNGSHPAGENPPDFGKQFEADVNETMITGPRRTPRQDAECALDELVEVAIRALSPGINDPFTAISCLHRLAASLGRVAERPTPDALRFDEDGAPRILARVTSFENLIDAAFNQIRQHGAQCVAVSIQMLMALRQIASHGKSEEVQSSIQRHAKMLHRDFRACVDQPDDGDDFQRRYDELTELLS